VNPLLVCTERRGVPVTILYRASRFEEVFMYSLTIKTSVPAHPATASGIPTKLIFIYRGAICAVEKALLKKRKKSVKHCLHCFIPVYDAV